MSGANMMDLLQHLPYTYEPAINEICGNWIMANDHTEWLGIYEMSLPCFRLFNSCFEV